MHNIKEIKINTEYIKIGQLLKLANIVTQGSEAKLYILEGFVCLDNTVVYERGKKVYPGSIVTVNLNNDIYNIKVI